MATSDTEAEVLLLREDARNFEPWLANLRTLLSRHGLAYDLDLDRETETALTGPEPTAPEPTLQERANSAAALTYAKVLIEPSLLQLVPAEDSIDLNNLIRFLETKTMPFRFLDLPPETRNKIYDFAIPQGEFVVVCPGAACGHTLGRIRNRLAKCFSIPQVSRHVRSESLGVVYSRLRFVLCPGFPSAERSLPGSMYPRVRDWASRMPPEQVQNINRINLRLYARTGPHCSKRNSTALNAWLRVTIEQGLRVLTRARLTAPSQNLLDAHVEKIETMRKLMGLRGEALFLSLSLGGDLWETGTLILA